MMTGNSRLSLRKAYSKLEGSSLSFGVCFSSSLVFAVKRAGLLQSSWIAGKWSWMGSIELTWFGGRIFLILSRMERSIMSAKWQVSSSDGWNLIDFSKSKVMVSSPTSKDIFWLKTSIMACAVAKNGLPRIREFYGLLPYQVADNVFCIVLRATTLLFRYHYLINGKWVKISMRKVHTLLEIEDNDDRKTYLDYLCIDLNYVEEQRNNLLSKHRDLVHELNACREQLLVLKQEKLNFLTMQHVNTEILKENKNLRTELKELTTITEIWFNSSNKVNQCIIKQILSQKKRILGVDQLTEHPSSSGQKDLVFEKSSADDTKVSILADESSVCSTPLPPLKKFDGTKPISGPMTIKSILRLKFTFKAKTLKGVTINEPSLAPAKGNKSSSASKVNSAPAGKLKSVKIKDDPPLAIVMKELNNLKLQINMNQSSYSINNQPQQVPQNTLQNKYKTQFKKSCDLCGLNNHLYENCYKVLFFKKYERSDHITCDLAEYISTKNISQHLKILGRSSSITKNPRPSKHFFPSCIHYRFSNHLSDDCVNYLICDICGSYDHDTHGHNRIISLRRVIKPRNSQHVMKSYEKCGSTFHTTTDHNDIEWFRSGEELQAKKAEALKSSKAESSNANRSKKSRRATMGSKTGVVIGSQDLPELDGCGTLMNKKGALVPLSPFQGIGFTTDGVGIGGP
ncbi:hypothetical protein Tco_1420142 [Tanacetum coccineum]